jgi:hypothetical protein
MRFQKKPVEARQFFEAGPHPFDVCQLTEGGVWFIDTPFGPLWLKDGDWVVRDEQDVRSVPFSVWKPAAFAAAFDPVSE